MHRLTKGIALAAMLATQSMDARAQTIEMVPTTEDAANAEIARRKLSDPPRVAADVSQLSPAAQRIHWDLTQKATTEAFRDNRVHWAYLQFPWHNGDVMGQTSYESGGLGWFGHLGLLDERDSSIVQVIGPVPHNVISRTDSVFHFMRGRTGFHNYWGARYDTEQGDFAIVAEALAQKYMDPSYTISSHYFGSWWEKDGDNWVIWPGRFRCDTFVVWCYKRVGHTNLTPPGIMRPANVFFMVPYARELTLFPVPLVWW